MRFVDYMRLSSHDDDIATFRSLRIQLVKEGNDYHDLIKRLSKKYSYVNESISIINELNKYLKTMYKGKYRYGFSIDEGINARDLNIKNGQKILLSMKCFEESDKLIMIKRQFENDAIL